MPTPVYCNGCKRCFTSIQYFEQHLKAKSHCANVFVERQSPGPNGLSRMTSRTREYKRQGVALDEFIDSVGDIIRKEESQKLEIKDLSVFEYCPKNDTPPPVSYKRIRVDKFRKSEKTTSASAYASLAKDINATIKAKLGLIDCKEGPLKLLAGLEKASFELTKPILALAQSIENTKGEVMDHSNDCNVEVDNSTFVVDEPNDTQEEVNDLPENEVDVVGPEPSTTSTPPKPNKKVLDDFREYIERAKREYRRYSPEMTAGIELMHLMNTKGGSVTLYDEIFKWHMDHLKTSNTVSAEILHKTLLERHNLGPTLPVEKETYLPHSGETVHIACHDAKAMEVDLLSDPRLCDDDYLFYNDDPYADPPEEWTKVGDVDSGLAHRVTWEKLIQPEPYTPCGRKKILCPHIIYFDATPTGNFSNLSLEIVKFTIGLLKGKTRNLSYAWRQLGYIRKITKRGNQAAKNISKSNHIDAKNYVKDPNHRKRKFMQCARAGEEEFDAQLYSQRGGGKSKKKRPNIKPQDLHAILQTILESYKLLEDDGGLPWDLWYKEKMYRLQLIPYIIFVKADSVEANKACGCYGSNGKGVKSLCRMCCVAAEQTDEPYVNPEPARKTQKMILDLVKKGTAESKQKLKDLSQHEIWNCFYRHRFGLHNNAGIHGATPMETLHWIQLNTYKYNREAFFSQTGETSQLSENLDSLTQTIGFFLERQSDRELPRTKYTDGIRGGKMNAHEMTGVMILLTLTLRSRAGRNLLLNTAWGDQKEFFPDEQSIQLWIQMLETHLMFEQWLGKEEHDIRLLEKAETKVKEMMALTKHVARRSKGMGYKTQSFHTTIHMPRLAMELCAPVHWNTQTNEQAHKADKRTAQRTSRQIDTFDISHAHKTVYRHAIELSMEEIHGYVRRWDYYSRAADIDNEPEYLPPSLTGASVLFYYSRDSESLIELEIKSRSTGKDSYIYDPNTLAFITSLAADLSNDHGIDHVKTFATLQLFSNTQEDNKQLFHAMPYFQGKPWNDWAMFDLSDADSDTPTARSYVAAQIKCFLDFSNLPQENALMQPPGLYAIIEPSAPNADENEIWWSDLFDPIHKEACQVPGFEGHNRQELVSIDRILHPATVVPDHENPNKRAYLRMIPMKVWSKMFDDWLDVDEE